MKYTIVVALSLASMVSAQADLISAIPACAQSCLVNSLTADGCSALLDFKCHCAQTGLVSAVVPCVQKACAAEPEKQSSLIVIVSSVCSSVGVPITIPTASATATSSSSSSAAPTTTTVASSTSVSTSVVSSTSSKVTTGNTLLPTTTSTSTVSGKPSGTTVGGNFTSSLPTQSTLPGAASHVNTASAAFAFILAGVAAFAL